MKILCCRWFCHVDDDNYVNVPVLVHTLQHYHHTADWYIGRTSIAHPFKIHLWQTQNVFFHNLFHSDNLSKIA